MRHYFASGLRHIEYSDTYAEADLFTRLDSQTNIVSLRFPFLLHNDYSSPSTPLPAIPTRTHLLSGPSTQSQLFLFPMPPLSPLPLTPKPTQDTFMHTADTLLPNLTIVNGPPHLLFLLAPSRPLIDASITISTPIYARFRPMTTLKSHPPSVRRLSVSPSSMWANVRMKRHFAVSSSYALTLRN